MGSAGIGSTGQLAGELFKMMVGVEFRTYLKIV
jgi:tripartite-type tricarboxylate transporter receptor subunit TctC